jgi:hypothetical protein
MSMPQYLLVLTRDDRIPVPSAAAVGALTGRLAVWVAALRRWRLLQAVAVGGSGAVRGCLLVTATDLRAARRLAASCPAPVTVLPIVREAG